MVRDEGHDIGRCRARSLMMKAGVAVKFRDLCSRKIVGWAINSYMKASLVIGYHEHSRGNAH